MRKTMAAITTLPNQPITRNNVARTMPQKASSGRPTADAKSSTFQATQKISGPSRITAMSTASATASPPATRAPIPRMRSTATMTGLTRRVYGVFELSPLSDALGEDPDLTFWISGRESTISCRREFEISDLGSSVLRPRVKRLDVIDVDVDHRGRE
jgi:hypothetical protein